MKPGFLTDSNGKSSSTRLLTLLCVPAIVLGPLAVWAALCLHKGAMVPMDPTIPLYIGTANGIILGFAGVKGYQETQIAAQPTKPPSL
jgi:hypothetical protein